MHSIPSNTGQLFYSLIFVTSGQMLRIYHTLHENRHQLHLHLCWHITLKKYCNWFRWHIHTVKKCVKSPKFRWNFWNDKIPLQKKKKLCLHFAHCKVSTMQCIRKAGQIQYTSPQLNTTRLQNQTHSKRCQNTSKPAWTKVGYFKA